MTTTPRLLRTIALEVFQHWAKPARGALPYLEAMASLANLDQMYGCDDAEDIVLRFLVNAHSWRSPEARRIKEELNTMLKAHKQENL